MNLAGILSDLLEEQQSLDDVVAPLSEDQWNLPTPSPRWTVTDQIGHLCYFDGAAALAIDDPPAFSASAAALLEAGRSGGESGDDFTLARFRPLPAPERLAAWRRNRAQLAAAAASLGDRDRVRWYGPSMSAKSFATARLMEAWAHGQDVCDAVGVERQPTDRLRHVAQLGYITRAWSYANRGLEPPGGDVAVELAAPSGAAWSWGDAEASGGACVRGAALDFCLVVTQRRRLADTELLVTGDAARRWMAIAQAFAGPPTSGPPSRPTAAGPPAAASPTAAKPTAATRPTAAKPTAAGPTADDRPTAAAGGDDAP